jgi:hypothetical protein
MNKLICKKCGRVKGSDICIAWCGKPEVDEVNVAAIHTSGLEAWLTNCFACDAVGQRFCAAHSQDDIVRIKL